MTIYGGITPSSSSQETMTYRVSEWTYGNGYTAIAPDGANAQIITWQLNWDNLSAANSALLEAWLETIPPWVTWTGDGAVLPSTLTFRMTKDGWQKSPTPGGVNSYQMNVTQVW